MTTPDEEWLIYQAVQACRMTTLNLYPVPNSCIETTRLTVKVLEKLGIKARPQAVNVHVFNSEAYAALTSGVPFDKWPPVAWSISTDPRSDDRQILSPNSENGWSGHLVVIIISDGQRRLIDPTADQFNRPGKLNVPGPVGMSIEGLWTPMDPLARVLQDENTVVEYRPLMGERGRLWKGTPAWNKDPDWFEETAEILAQQVREEKVFEGEQ